MARNAGVKEGAARLRTGLEHGGRPPAAVDDGLPGAAADAGLVREALRDPLDSGEPEELWVNMPPREVFQVRVRITEVRRGRPAPAPDDL